MSSSAETVLDFVANSEPKSLTYMGALDIGRDTRSAIAKHMIEKFDLGEAASEASIGAYVLTFAKQGFADVDLDQSRYNCRVVQHFTMLNEEKVLPVIGTTLDHSVKYPRFPLNLFLSSTPSKASRAPSNSVAIFEAALRGSDISLLAPDRYVIGNSNNSRVRTLIEAGVIIDDERNRFEINDPTYRGKRPLHYASQHIYRALRLAKEELPGYKWSHVELCEYVESLLPESHQQDAALLTQLRKNMHAAASIHSPRAFPGVINKVDVSKRFVQVADAYKEPVADLVERIARLRSSHIYRAMFAVRAREIYADVPTARELFIKGRQASPHVGNGAY